MKKIFYKQLLCICLILATFLSLVLPFVFNFSSHLVYAEDLPTSTIENFSTSTGAYIGKMGDTSFKLNKTSEDSNKVFKFFTEKNDIVRDEFSPIKNGFNTRLYLTDYGRSFNSNNKVVFNFSLLRFDGVTKSLTADDDSNGLIGVLELKIIIEDKKVSFDLKNYGCGEDFITFDTISDVYTFNGNSVIYNDERILLDGNVDSKLSDTIFVNNNYKNELHLSYSTNLSVNEIIDKMFVWNDKEDFAPYFNLNVFPVAPSSNYILNCDYEILEYVNHPYYITNPLLPIVLWHKVDKYSWDKVINGNFSTYPVFLQTRLQDEIFDENSDFSSNLSDTELKDIIDRSVLEDVTFEYLVEIPGTPFARWKTVVVDVPKCSNPNMYIGEFARILGVDNFNVFDTYVYSLEHEKTDNTFTCIYNSSKVFSAKSSSGRYTYLFLSAGKTFDKFYNKVLREEEQILTNFSSDDLYEFVFQKFIGPYAETLNKYDSENSDFEVNPQSICGYWGYAPLPVEQYTLEGLFNSFFGQPVAYFGIENHVSLTSSISYASLVKLRDKFHYTFLNSCWEILNTAINPGDPPQANNYFFLADPAIRESFIAENGAEDFTDNGSNIEEEVKDNAGKIRDTSKDLLDTFLKTLNPFTFFNDMSWSNFIKLFLFLAILCVLAYFIVPVIMHFAGGKTKVVKKVVEEVSKDKPKKDSKIKTAKVDEVSDGISERVSVTHETTKKEKKKRDKQLKKTKEHNKEKEDEFKSSKGVKTVSINSKFSDLISDMSSSAKKKSTKDIFLDKKHKK